MVFGVWPAGGWLSGCLKTFEESQAVKLFTAALRTPLQFGLWWVICNDRGGVDKLNWVFLMQSAALKCKKNCFRIWILKTARRTNYILCYLCTLTCFCVALHIIKKNKLIYQTVCSLLGGMHRACRFLLNHCHCLKGVHQKGK